MALVKVPASEHGTKFCDTLEVDQAAHRLYADDNWAGGIDVFDVSEPTPKYLKTIRTRGGFYGIAVASDLHKVFVGLPGGVVQVIDSDPASRTFDTLVAKIECGGHGAADLIDYDPTHHKVYVANRNDGFMTSIDAINNEILKRIDHLGGALEQPRYNPADGMVYLSGNAENVLIQVDAETDTFVRTFDIGEPCHPNGLAINPRTNIAVLANSGRNNKCVVWDIEAGRIKEVADTGGGDGAVYDPVADRFFFAASGYKDGPVVGVFNGEGHFLGNVPSQRMASWVAYDQTHRQLYVPTIEDGCPAVATLPAPAL
jgi:DNA-binding beta-propeller fold protein YncE